MADVTAQQKLNAIFQAIAEKLGEETGKKIKEAIDEVLNLEKIDVDALAKKIETISQVLDGDTDDEYSVQNIIGLLSEVSDKVKANEQAILDAVNRIKAVEADVAVLKGDESVEGSVAYQVAQAKAELDGKIKANTDAISTIQKDVDTLKTDVANAQTQAQEALKKAGLVGTKEVDEATIGDGKVLGYDATEGKLKYIDMPDPKSIINDGVVSADSTYSSEKIEQIRTDIAKTIAEKSEIDDSLVDASKTWSSQKISDEIVKARDAVEAEINEVKTTLESEIQNVQNDVADVKAQVQAKVNLDDLLAIDINAIASAVVKGLEAGFNGTTSTDSSASTTTTSDSSTTSSDSSSDGAL